jgi:hypothetical protein
MNQLMHSGVFGHVVLALGIFGLFARRASPHACDYFHCSARVREVMNRFLCAQIMRYVYVDRILHCKSMHCVLGR